MRIKMKYLLRIVFISVFLLYIYILLNIWKLAPNTEPSLHIPLDSYMYKELYIQEAHKPICTKVDGTSLHFHTVVFLKVSQTALSEDYLQYFSSILGLSQNSFHIDNSFMLCGLPQYFCKFTIKQHCSIKFATSLHNSTAFFKNSSLPSGIFILASFDASKFNTAALVTKDSPLISNAAITWEISQNIYWKNLHNTTSFYLRSVVYPLVRKFNVMSKVSVTLAAIVAVKPNEINKATPVHREAQDKFAAIFDITKFNSPKSHVLLLKQKRSLQESSRPIRKSLIQHKFHSSTSGADEMVTGDFQRHLIGKEYNPIKHQTREKETLQFLSGKTNTKTQHFTSYSSGQFSDISLFDGSGSSPSSGQEEIGSGSVDSLASGSSSLYNSNNMTSDQSFSNANTTLLFNSSALTKNTSGVESSTFESISTNLNQFAAEHTYPHIRSTVASPPSTLPVTSRPSKTDSDRPVENETTSVSSTTLVNINNENMLTSVVATSAAHYFSESYNPTKHIVHLTLTEVTPPLLDFTTAATPTFTSTSIIESDTTPVASEVETINVRATVGELFAMDVPSHWKTLLRSKVANLNISDTDTWLSYNPDNYKLVGVPLHDVGEFYSLFIHLTTSQPVKRPTSIVVMIEVLSRKLIHNPAYSVYTRCAINNYEIGQEKTSQQNAVGAYAAYFVLNVIKVLPYVEAKDISVVDANISYTDNETNDNNQQSIGTPNAFQVTWFVKKFSFKTFTERYQPLLLSTGDSNSGSNELFFALLPEFTLVSVSIPTPSQKFEDVSARNDTNSDADLPILLSLGLIACFIVLISLGYFVRHRHKRSRNAEEILVDRTFTNIRKPICFADEIEMDRFYPSNPRILAADLNENSQQTWTETIFNIESESGSDEFFPGSYESSNSLQQSAFESAEQNFGSYSFVNACFTFEDDSSSSDSSGLSTTTLFKNQFFRKKGD